MGRLFEKSSIYVKIEPERLMKIETGESVILVLHTPREKLLGILSEIGSAGIFVRAIDLGYFDDWCSSIAKNEPYLRMSDYFFRCGALRD